VTKKQTIGDVLKGLRPGVFTTITKIAPCGSLQARKQATGAVAFYWRYSIGEISDRELIGIYEPNLPPKSLEPVCDAYSYAAAVRAAEKMAIQHHATREQGGRPALLAARQAAKEAAAAERLAATKHTLQALIDRYVEWLAAGEKKSAGEARAILSLHVPEELRGRPANAIDKSEFVEILRVLNEAGKKTTARKVRGYLRAAYQCAANADSDTELPTAFLHFKVTVNPIASIKPIKGSADKNPLSLEALRAYWKAIKRAPGLPGAALRLHLLTGAQRPRQLLRATAEDVQPTALRLVDYKGRNTVGREHLIPRTKEIDKELAKLGKKGFLMSLDGGETAISDSTLSHWASDIAASANIEGFQLKRTRSAVETTLASIRVDFHIRGRLQSHGVSGVQATHYDAWAYLDEKREALQALVDVLESRPVKKHPAASNVVELAPKRRRA
jgi:integrase